MNDDSEKVDLASIYRDLADITSKEDDKHLTKILNKIKKAAAKGKYQIKIDVEEDVYDWVALPSFRFDKIKPELVTKLENYGFKLGSGNYTPTIFGLSYTVVIYWGK